MMIDVSMLAAGSRLHQAQQASLDDIGGPARRSPHGLDYPAERDSTAANGDVLPP